MVGEGKAVCGPVANQLGASLYWPDFTDQTPPLRLQGHIAWLDVAQRQGVLRATDEADDTGIPPNSANASAAPSGATEPEHNTPADANETLEHSVRRQAYADREEAQQHRRLYNRFLQLCERENMPSDEFEMLLAENPDSCWSPKDPASDRDSNAHKAEETSQDANECSAQPLSAPNPLLAIAFITSERSPQEGHAPEPVSGKPGGHAPEPVSEKPEGHSSVPVGVVSEKQKQESGSHCGSLDRPNQETKPLASEADVPDVDDDFSRELLPFSALSVLDSILPEMNPDTAQAAASANVSGTRAENRAAHEPLGASTRDLDPDATPHCAYDARARDLDPDATPESGQVPTLPCALGAACTRRPDSSFSDRARRSAPGASRPPAQGSWSYPLPETKYPLHSWIATPSQQGLPRS